MLTITLGFLQSESFGRLYVTTISTSWTLCLSMDFFCKLNTKGSIYNSACKQTWTIGMNGWDLHWVKHNIRICGQFCPRIFFNLEILGQCSEKLITLLLDCCNKDDAISPHCSIDWVRHSPQCSLGQKLSQNFCRHNISTAVTFVISYPQYPPYHIH